MHRNGSPLVRTGPAQGCASLPSGLERAGVTFDTVRPLTWRGGPHL